MIFVALGELLNGLPERQGRHGINIIVKTAQREFLYQTYQELSLIFMRSRAGGMKKVCKYQAHASPLTFYL